MKLLLLLFPFLLVNICFSQVNSSIQHDGENRTFVYYTPSGWDQSQQLPILFVLHGLTQTGNGLMGITGFNDIAEANNFIVCYPDGINNAWNANMNLTISSADDIGFIEALTMYFQSELNTNPLKQYLSGFSNGGYMINKIACESSICYAGVASVSGNMTDTVYNSCNPTHPTSILHIHGTLDPVVAYNGSPSTGVSVDASMEKWRGLLNCDVTPTSVAMANPNFLDFSSPERITYANCDKELELIKITGGGHQWPGIATLIGGLGNINMDFYSPQVIWEFLDGKSCPSSAGIGSIEQNQIKMYPNPIKDILVIESSQVIKTATIFNLTGEKMVNYEVNAKQKTLDISSLSSGIYFIHFNNTGKLQQAKIVKL